MATRRIPRRQMLDWLVGILRDNPCSEFKNDRGRIVDLDFDVLEIDAIVWWFRDFCRAPQPGIRPRVRRVARNRVRVLATILRVAYPTAMARMTRSG